MAEENNNLPAVIQTTELSAKEEMEQEIGLTFIENLLPKMKPMIKKLREELGKFLGKNEKLIVIRQLEGSTPQVIIFDNGKKFIIQGGLDNTDDPAKKKRFSVFKLEDGKTAIDNTFDTDQFAEMLLKGDFSKMKETINQ